MKIVLAGSLRLHALPEEAITLLKNWVEGECEFLVGDASGIDSQFQRVLNSINYQNVKVYFSGASLRNNIGRWPAVNIRSADKARGHALHGAKDRFMTEAASEGLMIWDGESAGTIANLIELLESGKSCYLFVSPESELLRLDSPAQLEPLTERYPEPFNEARKRLKKSKKKNDEKSPDSKDNAFVFEEFYE